MSGVTIIFYPAAKLLAGVWQAGEGIVFGSGAERQGVTNPRPGFTWAGDNDEMETCQS